MKWTDVTQMQSDQSGTRGGYVGADFALSGDNTIVAARVGFKIRVTHYLMSAPSAVNAYFKSGASTRISGTKNLSALGGAGASEAALSGHFETAVGEALVLNLSGAVSVGLDLAYTYEA